MASYVTIPLAVGTGKIEVEVVDTDKNREVISVVPKLPTATGAATKITGTGSSQTYSPPGGTTHVLVTVNAGNARYTEDGTAVTASTGLYLPVGFFGELPIPVGGTLKFITADSEPDAPIITLAPRKYV